MSLELRMALTVIIGFIFYVLVLKKFLFPFVDGMLVARQTRVKSAFDELAEERQALAALKTEYQAHLDHFEAERATLAERAQKEGRRIAQEIGAEAEQRHTELLAKGRQEIEREVQKARIQLRDEVVDAALGAARQFIDERLDADLHRALIDKYIEDLDRVS